MSQNNTNTNYQNRNSNINNNSNSRSNRNNNTNRNNNRNKHDGGKNTMAKNNKRNKSKNKYAFVMACNNATENECLDNQLLGGPSSTKRNEKGLGKTHERNKKITPLLFERCFL